MAEAVVPAAFFPRVNWKLDLNFSETPALKTFKLSALKIFLFKFCKKKKDKINAAIKERCSIKLPLKLIHRSFSHHVQVAVNKMTPE